MRFSTLEQWLAWQETLHPSEIELGLDRVAAVAERLGVLPPAPVVITVGGTNGKGSTVALLEAILLAAGYRVGAYTSPHLLRYNERIRLDGIAVDDAALCDAFARVDQARGATSLTYFEFATLAALDIFRRRGVEVVVLEVGMGGRLDAVNICDPDVAIVTTVDLDHAQWLGDDREAIGFEKAGIFRAGRPALFGSADPPASVLAHAAAIGARLYLFGRDFGYVQEGDHWRWWCGQRQRRALPLPALRGCSQLQNASAVLAALERVAERLPVTQAQIRAGLLEVRLAGRFQIVPGAVTWIMDVAHNPEAARELAANLAAMPVAGRTLAVVGMLADKDIDSVIMAVCGRIDRWYPADLAVARGAPAARLVTALAAADVAASAVMPFESVAMALAAAQQDAVDGDRIVIFGSFHTVAAALQRPV